MQIQGRYEHFKIKESKIARIFFYPSFLPFFLYKGQQKLLAFNIFFMHLDTFFRITHRAHNSSLYANMYIPYKASQDYIHKFTYTFS